MFIYVHKINKCGPISACRGGDRGVQVGRFLIWRWEFIKENKKVRKQELNQDSDQEKKEELNQKSDQENKRARTRPRKTEKNFLFFLIIFLVEFLFSYFLVFSYKFPPQEK